MVQLIFLLLGLYNRDYYVIESFVSRGVACMCVIGGGYSSDINELSLRHTIVHRAATKVFPCSFLNHDDVSKFIRCSRSIVPPMNKNADTETLDLTFSLLAANLSFSLVFRFLTY